MRKVGIDISAYQGRPAPLWFDSLPALGIEVGWVQAYGGRPGVFGIGPNPHAEYQLRQFRRVGCDIGMYVWLPPQLDVNTVIREAVQACGEEFPHLLFGSLDIEGRTVHGDARLMDAYTKLRAALIPRPVTLYTSVSQWRYQGNTTIFSDAPLHEAWYFNLTPAEPPLAAFDATLGLPFGDWTQRAAWQYFGGEAGGVGADWNIFDYDRMGITVSLPQEDGMTDQELITIIKNLQDNTYVEDGFIVWWVSWPTGADYPILRRIDDSRAALIRAPVRHIPLAVAAYLPKGPDI